VGVKSVLDSVNNLHSFGVVNLLAVALIVIKKTKSSIEWARNKLSTRRSEIYVCDCRNVSLMYKFSSVHPSKIKWVTVWVIISHCEVHGLQRIEADTGRFVGKSNFLDSSLPSEVVDKDGPIWTSTTKNVWVRRRVPDFQNTVYIPLQLIDGFTSLVRPDLYNLPRSCKLLSSCRMLNVALITKNVPRTVRLRYLLRGWCCIWCLPSLKSPAMCSWSISWNIARKS